MSMTLKNQPTPRVEPRVQIPRTGDSRVRFAGMSWETYQQLVAELDQPHLRIVYDRGEVEIVTLSLTHENLKKWLGRLFEALTEEMNIPILSCGSVTIVVEEQRRGVEADDWYYIANEPLVRGIAKINLNEVPAPDLAVEIEVTNGLLQKLPIFAALRIPEVWRFDGVRIRVYVLQLAGQYLVEDRSLAFPWLPLADVVRFVLQMPTTAETTVVRDFRAWVRSNLDENGKWRP